MYRLFLALGILGSAAGALAACSSTTIETRDIYIDAAPPDVTLPDSALFDVAWPDGALPDARANEDAPATHDSSAQKPDAEPPLDAGSDAAPDCAALPPILRPPADASVFCPFSAPFGQPPLRCAASDECCETPPDAGVLSTCAQKGTACPVPSSTRWECQDRQNCGAGQVCCAVGPDGGAVGFHATGACGYPYVSAFDGTRCMAACGAGTMEICETPGSCAAGTCTPMRARGVELGVCL